ncbi:MAG: hypothetical protein KAI55_03500 [Candidatus Aenigmarchaeota archaeon]|nr:hypothetical protein [Candidatus Aenigmarchaeota archaeon]
MNDKNKSNKSATENFNAKELLLIKDVKEILVKKKLKCEEELLRKINSLPDNKIVEVKMVKDKEIVSVTVPESDNEKFLKNNIFFKMAFICLKILFGILVFIVSVSLIIFGISGLYYLFFV